MILLNAFSHYVCAIALVLDCFFFEQASPWGRIRYEKIHAKVKTQPTASKSNNQLQQKAAHVYRRIVIKQCHTEGQQLKRNTKVSTPKENKKKLKELYVKTKK